MKIIKQIALTILISSSESVFSTGPIKPRIHSKFLNDGTYIITLSKFAFFDRRLYNPRNLNDITRITKEIKKHASHCLPDICQIIGVEYTSNLIIESVDYYETHTKKPPPVSEKYSAQATPNKYTLTLAQQKSIKPLNTEPCSEGDDHTDSAIGDITAFLLSQIPQISIKISLQNISCCNKTIIYEFKKEVTNTYSENDIMVAQKPEQKRDKNDIPSTSVAIH